MGYFRYMKCVYIFRGNGINRDFSSLELDCGEFRILGRGIGFYLVFNKELWRDERGGLESLI